MCMLSTVNMKNINRIRLNHSRKIAYTILCLCISLVTILPVFSVLFIVRLVVGRFLRYYTKGRFMLMAPADATMGIDKEQSFRFTMVCEVGTQMNQLVLENLRNKIGFHVNHGLFTKLRYRLCTRLGFPCWEDLNVSGKFDISNHVNLYPGIQDWNQTTSEKEMMSLLADNVNSPESNDGQPDWGILLVPKVRNQSQNHSTKQIQTHTAVLFFYANHCYMDGNWAVEFMHKCICDVEKESPATMNTMNKLANEPLSIWERLIFNWHTLFHGTKNYLDMVLGSKQGMFQAACSNSRETYMGISKSKITNATMNKIRVAFDCQTRSVVTFAFLKALVVQAERKELLISDTVNIACTHAIVPYPNLELQNRAGAILRRLPTSGTNQLFEIDKLMQLNKDYEYNVNFVFWVFNGLGILPSSILCFVKKCIMKTFPFGVTLAPGPEPGLKIQNGSLDNAFASVPLLVGINYTCVFCTYGGTFNFSFHFRKTPLIDSQHDLQTVIAEFEDCFQDLDSEATFKLREETLESKKMS